MPQATKQNVNLPLVFDMVAMEIDGVGSFTFKSGASEVIFSG